MRNMRSHNAPMFVIIPEIYNCYKLVILPNHLIIAIVTFLLYTKSTVESGG